MKRAIAVLLLVAVLLFPAACSSLGTDAGQAAAEKLNADTQVLLADVLDYEIGATPDQLKLVAMIRGADYFGALATLATMTADPKVAKLRADVETVVADFRALNRSADAKARAAR